MRGIHARSESFIHILYRFDIQPRSDIYEPIIYWLTYFSRYHKFDGMEEACADRNSISEYYFLKFMCYTK